MINLDGVSVVSIGVGYDVGASHTLCLNISGAANSHLCLCELMWLLQ